MSEVRDHSGRVLEGPHKHMRILERRKVYLDGRVEKGRRDGKDLMYDEMERDALEWAIQAIYDWVELPGVGSDET